MTRKKPDPPSIAALKSMAAAELTSLSTALEHARPGESVHGARRRIKSLRSLMRLVKPALGKAAFGAVNDGLRDAADSLAGLRRAEALVATAQKFLAGEDEQNGYWPQLAAAHRAADAAVIATDGGLHAARAALERAETALASARLRAADRQALGNAVRQHYAKARRLLRQGLESCDAEELHVARKFVIHHLHHLSILAPHLRPVRKRLAAIERLRAALGDLNDLDELTQLSQADGTGPCSQAAQQMSKARLHLLAKVEKAANLLFEAKPRAMAEAVGLADWNK